MTAWFESNFPNIPTCHALVHILRQFGAIKLNYFFMRVNHKSPTGRVQESYPLLAGTSSTEPVWSWFKDVPVASADVIFSGSHI